MAPSSAGNATHGSTQPNPQAGPAHGQGENVAIEDDGTPLNVVDEATGFDRSRMNEFMHSLQKLARLRTLATTASVHARQKKREASIKRQNVWKSDGKFMGEVQRLASQGKFEGLDELARLALDCQHARDILGPIEQESIETEQEWEGHAWSLHQAEEEFDYDYRYEFELADSYPATSSNSSSSDYSEASSIIAEETEPIDIRSIAIPASVSRTLLRQLPPDASSTVGELLSKTTTHSSTPQDIEDLEVPILGRGSASDSGSGYEDIDKPLPESIMGRQWTTSEHFTDSPTFINEFYPQLLTDFTSTRERINHWLEASVLSSRFQATSLFSILKETLEADDQPVPSHWAQLVVAFWDNDEAAQSKRHIHQTLSGGDGNPGFWATCLGASGSDFRQLQKNSQNTDVAETLVVESDAIPKDRRESVNGNGHPVGGKLAVQLSGTPQGHVLDETLCTSKTTNGGTSPHRISSTKDFDMPMSVHNDRQVQSIGSQPLNVRHLETD